MYAFELKRKLMEIPDNMEITIHHNGSGKIYSVDRVYTGNEKYLPKGKKDKPDIFVIETD